MSSINLKPLVSWGVAFISTKLRADSDGDSDQTARSRPNYHRADYRHSVMPYVWLLIIMLLAPSVASGDALDDLQPGHWTALGTNTIKSVLPSPLPFGSPSAVIRAWSGGWFDTTRNRYCVHGGGHGDYAGNEIYCFDLATFAWARIWGPTANEFIPSPPATIGETYANGDPRSRHSYGGLQYLPNVDKYFVHGGSLWSGSGGMGRATWFFDPSRSAWSLQGDIAGCVGTASPSIPRSAYDPSTGKLYVHKYSSFCEFDPLRNTWKKRGVYGPGASTRASAVMEPVSKQFYLIGAGLTRSYDLTRTDNLIPLVTLTTTGDKTAELAMEPGCDPVGGKVYCWAGGAELYMLDPATRQWTKIPAAATNAITPTAPVSAGTHGRWRYIRAKNVFLVVNGIDQPVYAYKLASSLPPPPPPPALNHRAKFKSARLSFRI
jgi:hypothetical protein